MVVPSGRPASQNSFSSPPDILRIVPVSSSLVLVHISRSHTAPMLESASPRKPRDLTNLRSSALRILLVAWGSTAVRT